MRKYPINSDAAIGRVVAAALLADGALDKSELELLERGHVAEKLGISGECLERVIHEFCDDLDQYGLRNESGMLEVGREAVDRILGEINDPILRRQLLAAIIDIVCADRRLSVSEVDLAAQAMLRWGVSPRDAGYELHPFSPRWPKQFDRAAMGIRL
jgi:uncharacterized tellurite resistance protein B-like protein